ncbi:tRNA(m5U54)methyltransferase [Thelotrema lepadinum]|nr:tRNA(m5U54)methyltransferase [Thelotrema lepadinum]
MSKRKSQDKKYRGSTKRVKKEQLRFEGSNDEVLAQDVRSLLSSSKFLERSEQSGVDQVKETDAPQTPEKFAEVEVDILELSSVGDGIGISSNYRDAFVVPFCLPGDTVKAKVIRTNETDRYVMADFVAVVKHSELRDDSLVKCPYFAKCGGCHFQMMKYEDQLAHKKTIVEKAYRNFSGLDSLPEVEDTIGSPLQYGYRTKLTPHFDGPPGMKRHNRGEPRASFQEVPPIGFMQKGTRWTIDIEDCPIGTDVVRDGMKQERVRVTKEIGNYKKGATLLLRESTHRTNKGNNQDSELENPSDASEKKPNQLEDQESVDYVESKTYITDSNAISTEYVDSFRFDNPAGSFFQNNNSILPVFTQYIRDQIQEASSNTSLSLTNLIDAYCGSGLFTITLSTLFQTSIGIDVSPASITSAKKNAQLNNTKNTTFIAATASELFKSVTSPSEQTVVVIDPPRKGCDESFLEQLLQFGPRLVIYVSCNVHTQARDIGYLVNGTENEEAKYRLKSLQGFDFFPQTGHVEGVAVLVRAESKPE